MRNNLNCKSAILFFSSVVTSSFALGQSLGQQEALRTSVRVDLPDEQVVTAKPLETKNGSLWKSPLSSKAFAAGRVHLLTPFDQNLLERSYLNGVFGINDLQKFSSPVRMLTYSNVGDSTACALCDSKDVPPGQILLLDGDNIDHRLNGHSIAPWMLLFSPDGNRLASYSDDGSVRLWDSSSGHQVASLKGTKYDGPYGLGTGPLPLRGHFIDFSPNGKLVAIYFAIGGDERGISIRHSSDGTERFLWHVDTSNCTGIRFSNDSRSVFAFYGSSQNGKSDQAPVIQIDLETLEKVEFNGKCACEESLIVPDDEHLITYNESSALTIWDIKARSVLKNLEAAPHRLNGATLSPRGTYVATFGDDNEIKFWKIATLSREMPKVQYSLNERLDKSSDIIEAIQFSPDGEYLVAATKEISTIGNPKYWLWSWRAPEFCRNYAPAIVNQEIFSDGMMKTRYGDGVVTYSQIQPKKK